MSNTCSPRKSRTACTAAMLFAAVATSTSLRADDPQNPFHDPQPQWQEFQTASPALSSEAWTTPPASAAVEPVANREPAFPLPEFPVPELPAPEVDPAAARLLSTRIDDILPDVTLTPPEPAALPIVEPVAEVEVTPVDAPPAVHLPKPVRTTATEKPEASAKELEGMLQGMVWVTASIGLGAVVLLWLVRMWLTRGGRMMMPARSLKVIETLRVSPRCGLYLVQAESHRVLVAVEQGKSMSMLPLPASFSESLEAIGDEPVEGTAPTGFERVADVFAALRQGEERGKGARS